MRIVVTGATGNVGSALLRRLGRDGDHDLIGLARRPPIPAADAGPITWIPLDLTEPRNGPRLVDAFRGADAVVHLVWGFQPSHDVGYLRRLGVGGTRMVLEAVAAAGVPHLVHMSSVGAYSQKRDDHPVDELYPTDGIPASPYSRHKAQAERLLDAFVRDRPEVVVTRLRPGIIGQSSAGSSLLRYTLPTLLPAPALRVLPLLPLDRSLRIPVVHADDVADACARSVAGRAGGAFNLAADEPVTVDDIASALGARHVQVPKQLIRALMAATWRARLQPLDPGWISLAYGVPLLSSDKARRQLAWSPCHDGPSVITEAVAGMRSADRGSTPALRGRSVLDGLARAVTSGPVSLRRRP